MSAESVSGLGEGRSASRFGSSYPRGVCCARGGIGGRRLGDPLTPRLGVRPRGTDWDKCARSSTPFPLAFRSRRNAPLAGVAARSPGMRARESQFGPTAEAPEVTPNFFALAGVLQRGPRRTLGKGWPERPEEGQRGNPPPPRARRDPGTPWKLWGPLPPKLASFPSQLTNRSEEMGSRFKKSESDRRGKFAKVLLFDVFGGWSEVADTSWKG